MKLPMKFEVTEDHIKLLRLAYVEWGGCAPTIDPKRPYGNSDVILDVAGILGVKMIIDRYGEKVLTAEQAKHCEKIHEESWIALQIFLCMGEMKPGVYIRKDEFEDREWWRE